MIVDDVGKVVGGQAVPLDEHLVVQGGVLHGNVPEYGVGEDGGTPGGDLLADDVGGAGGHLDPGLLQAHVPAGVGRPVKVAGVLLRLGLFAEAVIGVALLHQQLGVLAVQRPALGLDVGSHRAADVGALIPGQAALAQGGVDDLGGALHQAALVGILNTEDELAAAVAGDEPGVEGGAEVAHVHVARGGGGEAGADAVLGDAGFHLLKPVQIH